MYCYVVTNFADDEIFYQKCKTLEKRISDLQPEKLMKDADGTLIQQYRHVKGKVRVRSDVRMDYVDIQSDFDLLPYFGENGWTGEKRKFRDHDTVRIKKTGVSGKIIGVYYCMGGIVLYEIEGPRRKDGNSFGYRAKELEKVD